MISLVYVSAARIKFDGERLTELLAQCRRNNSKRRITGALLYAGGNFMQALEGDASAVDQLFDKVKQDSRHGGVTQIYRATIEARQFDNWAMGLADLSALSAQERAGCMSLLHAKFDHTEAAAIAPKLLERFRETMVRG